MRSVVVICLAALALASALELSSSVRSTLPKASTAPGLRGVLSQNGANYLLDAILPVVFAKVQGLQIPEIDGESKVPILGHVKYYVKNINVNTVNYGSASIGMQNDFSLDVEGVEVKISADWEYKQKSWPHIKSSGSADIKISNSAVAIALSTGITSSGDPQLEVQSVNADFKDLSVKIHGSILSWLYDLIFDIAKNTIKKAAAKSVEAELTNLINNMADSALAKLKLVVPVSKSIAVDFSLTDAPSFPNSALTVDLKGQFQNITNPTPAPLPHVAFPTAAPTQHVLIQMDQFLFNSGLWLLFQSGKLDWTITQKDIPAKIPFSLNTTTFATVLPELEKAFPSAAIEWRFSPLTIPSANFTQKGLAAGAVFAMDWLATNPSGQFVEAFTAELDFGVVAALAINSTSLTGNLSVTDFNLELMSSNIGPVDLTMLNFFLTTIIEGPLIDIINALFAQGLPLPSFAGISLKDASFSYFPQYAEFSADLSVPTRSAPAPEVSSVRFN